MNLIQKNLKKIYNYLYNYTISHIQETNNVPQNTYAFKVAKKKEISIKESTIEVKDIEEYKTYLKEGFTNFDLQNLNLKDADLTATNLENCNLTINLTDLKPHPQTYPFIDLSKTNLKGNNITEPPAHFRKQQENLYFWYTEDTFDNNYQKTHPNYFLSRSAPKELKEKYYNPKRIVGLTTAGEITHFLRQSLTFDEYIEYYSYLSEKYLGNFRISQTDLNRIKLVSYYEKMKTNCPLSALKAISQLSTEEVTELLRLPAFNPSDEKSSANIYHKKRPK